MTFQSFSAVVAHQRPGRPTAWVSDSFRFATEAEAERHAQAVGGGRFFIEGSNQPVNARRDAGRPLCGPLGAV